MELTFGAMGPTISQQLKKQKLAFDPSKVKTFEKFQHSITLLKIHSLINESAAKSARNKLFKMVTANVKSLNKVY